MAKPSASVCGAPRRDGRRATPPSTPRPRPRPRPRARRAGALEGGGHPAAQPATTDGDEHVGQPGDLVESSAPIVACPAHDVGVVERRDERRPGRPRPSARATARQSSTVWPSSTTSAPYARVACTLGSDVPARHVDGGVLAEHRRRQRDALRVVAGRRRDDRGAGSEPRLHQVRAADLERPGALEELGLQPDLPAEPVAERVAVRRRRRADHGPQHVPGLGQPLRRHQAVVGPGWVSGRHDRRRARPCARPAPRPGR